MVCLSEGMTLTIQLVQMKKVLLSAVAIVPVIMATMPAPSQARSCSYEYMNGRMVYVCCNQNGFCWQEN